MNGRWYIQTPSGHFVPGMSGPDEAKVWRRYCDVMGQTREQLEAKGYRTVQPRPGK